MQAGDALLAVAATACLTRSAGRSPFHRHGAASLRRGRTARSRPDHAVVKHIGEALVMKHPIDTGLAPPQRLAEIVDQAILPTVGGYHGER